MCQYSAEQFDVSSHYVAWLPADAVLRRVSKECCNGKQRLASNDGTPSQFSHSAPRPYCPGPNPVTPSWPTDSRYISLG
jgi:hypothetical protein